MLQFLTLNYIQRKNIVIISTNDGQHYQIGSGSIRHKSRIQEIINNRKAKEVDKNMITAIDRGSKGQLQFFFADGFTIEYSVLEDLIALAEEKKNFFC